MSFLTQVMIATVEGVVVGVKLQSRRRVPLEREGPMDPGVDAYRASLMAPRAANERRKIGQGPARLFPVPRPGPSEAELGKRSREEILLQYAAMDLDDAE